MILDPVKLRSLAEARARENFEFRDFLKHHSHIGSEKVDRLVSGISDEVWKSIDCTTCGNCCREVSPTLNNGDVERVACHLGVSQSEFASKHLKPAGSADGAPWVMGERPCPFLSENRCTVYAQRPANCRDYPYLDKPDFLFRTLSMIGRLSECPAVFEVWERLKVATGFHRRRR